MYDKEAVAQSDLLAAKVALANALQQQLRATNGLRIATAAYNRFVGEPMDRVPELDPPMAPVSQAGAGALPELVKSAIAQRPELAALSAQQDAYDAAARAERAQALPQVGLRAGVTHMDNQILDRQDFASVGVGFQWRLFDSGQLAARTSALHSRARAAGRRLDDLRSLIRLDVESAFYNREDALARIHAASASVAQADENLRIARELYANGLNTNNQVLDAEALRVIASSNRDDAAFDAMIAGYRLLRAIGGL